MSSSQTRFVSRRVFLTVALGAAGAVVGACSPAAPAAPTAAPTSPAKPAATAAAASTTVSAAGTAPASATQPAAAATPGSAEAPKETAEIVVGLQGGGLSNDPAKSTAIEDWAVVQAIYNGLLRYKPGGSDLEGDLAEHWDISKDGKTYTFQLRKGVEFHGGYGAVTADDVKFTFERIEDPAVASVNKGFLWMVDSITAIDPQTVQIQLKQPFAPFLSIIALGRPMVGAIVSKAAADKLGNANYSDHPIGTGPFVFQNKIPNQSWSFTRNDNYYEGKPYAKAVKMLNMPDQTTLGLAMEKGEVNIGNARGADTLTKYKDNSKATLHSGPTFNIVGINVNTRKPPFDKVEVRQALAMAINEKELVDGVQAGFASLANLGLLTEGMVGYDNSIPVPAYDPEKAKSMLATAGATNVKVTWPVYTGSEWTTAGALLQQEMQAAGVNATIPQLERGALTQQRRDKNTDGTVISLTTGADPDTMMRYLTTSQLPPGLNYSWYTAADDLVDATESALSEDARVAAIKKVQQKFAADVPFLPMYHQLATVLTSLNYRGYQRDPLGGYWLQKAWLA